MRIEACRVDLTPVRIDSGVTLEPRQNSFEIEYTALSFIKSGRIRFKYKLEGLESEWVDAGTRRTAYYSHVPPGNYTFRVIAANADGIWNSQGDALRFDVLPPFYRTAWFSMLICTVAAGLLYLAWHSRVSQLERVNAMQQAFSRQLIESQESERKRIASELHDSLGQHLLIIKNRASLGERFAPDAGRMVDQFSEITESASLAISEVRAIAYNLRPLNLERLGLTAVLEEMIEKVSAASAIQFTADIAPLDGLLAHGADINIYRIVQETINNIVKHSEATKASIELRRRGREHGVLHRHDQTRAGPRDLRREQAAVLSMTRSVAAGLVNQNVRVFAVCPCTADTPMTDRLADHQPHAKGQLAALTPSGRSLST